METYEFACGLILGMGIVLLIMLVNVKLIERDEIVIHIKKPSNTVKSSERRRKRIISASTVRRLRRVSGCPIPSPGFCRNRRRRL